MSSLFQGPLVLASGRVRIEIQASAVLPSGITWFRGMPVIAATNAVPVLIDDGVYPRIFRNGIAFEATTGMLLIATGSATPGNMVPGGLFVDANGVVIYRTDPDLIHQGVGLTWQGFLSTFENAPTPPPPIANAGGPYTGNTGINLTFDGTGSTPGTGASIVQYDWDFGEGSGWQNDIGPQPTGQYGIADTYTVQLRVTDNFAQQNIDSTTATITDAPVEFLGSCLDQLPTFGGYEDNSLFCYKSGDGATVRWFSNAYFNPPNTTHCLTELTGSCDTLNKTGSWEIALESGGTRNTWDTATNAIGKQQTGIPRTYWDNERLELAVAQKHPSNSNNCESRLLGYDPVTNEWSVLVNWTNVPWILGADHHDIVIDEDGEVLLFYMDSTSGLRFRHTSDMVTWSAEVVLDATVTSGGAGNMAATMYGDKGVDQKVAVTFYDADGSTLRLATIPVPAAASKANYQTVGNWSFQTVRTGITSDNHLSIRGRKGDIVIANKHGAQETVYFNWLPSGEGTWIQEQINTGVASTPSEAATRPNVCFDGKNNQLICFYGTAFTAEGQIWRRRYDLVSRTWAENDSVYAVASGTNARTAMAPYHPVDGDTGYVAGAREGVWSQSPL